MENLPKSFLIIAAFALLITAATAVSADPFIFTTGAPDGRIATASRPDSPGKFEIESADDFILSSATSITHAGFTGLLPSGTPLTNVLRVRVEIYRVFPADSANPPSGNVPTRVNSPSDVAFDERDSSDNSLHFVSTLVNGNFSVLNTVLPGGIHVATGGNGPTTGEEVEFDVDFSTPFLLPADHYFFVPQVELTNGNFLWLSAARPLFTGDLQSWTRDANLDPDWLRVGTDIVGGTAPPTFNASFSLQGNTVPEPASMLLFGTGLTAVVVWARKRRKTS